MENKVINLTNWIMYSVRDMLVLGGIADEHPRLGKNIYLAHTSYILNIDETENHVLECKTLNSVYRCDWKFVNLSPELRLGSYRSLNCDKSVVDTYKLYLKLVKHRMEKQHEDDLQLYYDLIAIGKKELLDRSELGERNLVDKASKYTDCVYMDVSTISHGNTLAFNIHGESGVIKSNVLPGDYVNTVSYRRGLESGLKVGMDYFVGSDSMDICFLTPEIKSVVLHNEKLIPIVINGKIMIQPDETKILDASTIIDKIE